MQFYCDLHNAKKIPKKLNYTLTFTHSLEKKIQITLWGIF